MNTNLPMWPLSPTEIAAISHMGVLSLADKCAECEYPHAKDSSRCYACMPAHGVSVAVLQALEADVRWQLRLRQTPGSNSGPKRVASGTSSGGVKTLNNERRNGAKVQYPLGGEAYSEVCPTIYTPKSCYPYPNHRRRLGLAGSYPTSACKVIDIGWIPGQKPQGGV